MILVSYSTEDANAPTAVLVTDICELRTEDGLYLLAKGHHDVADFIRAVTQYLAGEWDDDWSSEFQVPEPDDVKMGWGRYQFGDPVSVVSDDAHPIVLSDIGQRVRSMRGVFPYTGVPIDRL